MYYLSSVLIVALVAAVVVMDEIQCPKLDVQDKHHIQICRCRAVGR